MSDRCKRKQDFTEDEDSRARSIFVECHNEFGALQPPLEGWDPVEQKEIRRM